jgi:ubiquinone/menaquinone biosynthesis C-methylase UbiE
MTKSPLMDSVYEILWDTAAGEAFARLDRSLNPRPPGFLYDWVAEAGIGTEHLILDVGCGRGNQAYDLSRRFGCRVIGIDPVWSNLKAAQQLGKFERLFDLKSFQRVNFEQASMDAIPLSSHTIDLVWCRDMLVHVAELETALGECSRVLKPGGTMVVFTTFATDLMEAQELAYLCAPIAVQTANLSTRYVEDAFQQAGLMIQSNEVIGGELIEHMDERDGRHSQELLRVARMVRSREQFVEQLGEQQYEIALALYRWGIYLLLGKLSMSIYTLRKPE